MHWDERPIDIVDTRASTSSDLLPEVVFRSVAAAAPSTPCPGFVLNEGAETFVIPATPHVSATTPAMPVPPRAPWVPDSYHLQHKYALISKPANKRRPQSRCEECKRRKWKEKNCTGLCATCGIPMCRDNQQYADRQKRYCYYAHICELFIKDGLASDEFCMQYIDWLKDWMPAEE